MCTFCASAHLHIRVCGGQRTIPCVNLQGPETRPLTGLSQASEREGSPVSASQELGLQVPVAAPGFLGMGSGNLPLAVTLTVSAFLTQLLPSTCSGFSHLLLSQRSLIHTEQFKDVSGTRSWAREGL